MAQKIRYVLFLLILWALGFLAWEWWYSYPKVNLMSLTPENSWTGKIDSMLYQAVNQYRLPGVSVAIVQNGKVSYLNAVGYKNLETKDSLTVNSEILVASVSKLFTALSVASVLQENNIYSHDLVNELGLGEIIDSSYLSQLTFQELLSHQSSIRDKNFSEMILSFSKSQSLEAWGSDFLENSATYQTDSKAYNYSDSNFDLLGFLISQFENIRFDSLIQRNVLTALGMMNSEFLTKWPIEERALTGYQHTFLWKRLEPKRINFKILPSPSSGLLTTTKDMSMVLIHLLRGDMGINYKALDWLTIDGNEVPLGFQQTQINGSDWIGHFGGQAGYSSLLFYSKEEEMGIFLFSNSKDNENFRISIANQIIAYISR